MRGRKVRRNGMANCRRATRANSRAPRCVRFVKVTVLSAQEGGGNQFTAFSGRVRGKALKPGPYRARIVAADAAGQASAPRQVSFRIVPG
jgi:hypothetical protein